MKALYFALAITLFAACSSLPTGETQSSADYWLAQPLPDTAVALQQGDVSATALVRAYLSRIEAIDRSGPTLKSVLALNPRVLEEAQALDKMLAKGVSAGPMHGLPILIKDNIETRDPMATTAGSTALANNITERDSPLIAGLRSAGALILGKTNLSQWANYRSTRSLSGWSAIGGQVRNPHILDRNPCGSSSGSGAAVAAALASGAVGTETNGSIICPSNANGIVGFKPTVGLVSTEHIVPISFTQDTAGPMTRSVAGAALMLDAMSGQSVEAPFTSELSEASLTGVRLGVLRYAQGSHPGIIDRFEAALQALVAQGAVLVDIDERPQRPENFGASAQKVMSTEFKHSLNAYLAATPEAVATRTLKDVIAYNNAHADAEMALFGQEIFETAEATGGINDATYQNALKLIQEATRQNGIDALLAQYNLSALIFPSGPLVPAVDYINGDVWPEWVGDGSSAAIAGYPHLTVPIGTVRAAPIGLSFVGTGGQDAEILSLGYAFEQATKMRVEPGFLPTASADR